MKLYISIIATKRFFMNKNFILFFQFCFAFGFLLGSDTDSRKKQFKDNLDKVFEKFKLTEFNQITGMSQKIVEKQRNDDQLEALVFLSCRSYKEYLKGQSFLLSQNYNVSIEQSRMYTKTALEEFENKEKDIIEILKAHNDRRSSFVDDEVQSINNLSDTSARTDQRNNEFEKLLPLGLLEDDDYK